MVYYNIGFVKHAQAQNGLATITNKCYFPYPINTSRHISFNLMVKFIDPILKTTLCMMQYLSYFHH